MNLDNVRRDDWILGGLGVVLIIDLVAFPWFSLGSGPFSLDLVGTDTPDGWLGVLAVIALILLVADLAVERFSPQTQVPAIGASRTMTRFVLAVAAAGFMALKFLFHLGHFSDLGWGFWLGAILAAGLVFVALQARAGTPLAAGPAGVSTPPAGTGNVGTTTVGSPPPPPATPPAGEPAGPPPSSPPPGS